MNDKQKIKAKIGKLKSEYNKESNFRTVRGDTAREVLDELLSFIDSLPKDAESKDLDEEIVDWCNHGDLGFAFDYEDIRDTANHFANWQKQQMMKDALNCSIIIHPNDRFANYSVSAYVPPLHPASTYISNGEKVKIILIKEEEL